MKIIECTQGTPEWFGARVGIPTASEFDSIISPGKWEPRKGETPQTYLAKKLAEWWMGTPLLAGGAWATDQGQALEKEAIPWFEFEYNTTVQRVGFVTSDDGRIGCSPDGLIGDDSGIEAKCPDAHTHVKNLLRGEVPPDYLAQVHGSMFVTGRSSWRFLSYRRGFPALVLTVDRDEAIQGAIGDALGAFLERFEAGKNRLKELNGGERQASVVPTSTEPAEEWVSPF